MIEVIYGHVILKFLVTDGKRGFKPASDDHR